jgi:hypothetical protein
MSSALPRVAQIRLRLRKRRIMFALGFPLLLIPFAVYNMIAFLTPGVSWTSTVTTVHMMSGQDWVLTWEDILLAFAIFLLWVELIKSTRAGMRSAMDHVLAMALFIVMLVEFLLVQRAATSTFFLLMAIALVDVLAGFIVSMRSATRQIEVEGADRA